jgi:tetratricopeptide (TPR) repeat protein
MWWLIVGRGYTHPLGHLAQCYIERDNINYAVEIQERAAGLLLRLDESSDWRGLVHYRLATHYAGLGQMERAIDELREAFQLDPCLVERSKEEPCLAAMRENPEFHSLHAE